jgi:hypothetical protein
MTKDLKGFRNTVPVKDIPEDGLHLVFEDMQGLLSDTEECRIQCPAKEEVFLHRVDGAVHLKGKVAALIVLKCDRCSGGVQSRDRYIFFLYTGPWSIARGKKRNSP